MVGEMAAPRLVHGRGCIFDFDSADRLSLHAGSTFARAPAERRRQFELCRSESSYDMIWRQLPVEQMFTIDTDQNKESRRELSL